MDKEKAIAFFKDKSNKIKLIVAIGLVGIVLIMMSEIIPGGTKEKSTEKEKGSYMQTDMLTYQEKCTQELTKIISKISGVGKCSVMITFENTTENVYAYNSATETGDKGEKHEYNYIIIDGENGEQPVTVKEIQPKVKGVVVVCEGGENISVKESVTECVRCAYDISAGRISVNKMTAE